MSSDMPAWLTQPSDTLSDDELRTQSTASRKLVRTLLYERFEIAYDGILDAVMSGSTLASALQEHPQCFDHGKFVRWINSDPERKRRYVEAKELRAEAWAGEIVRHAKAEGSMEDVQRSKLICDSYKWLIQADNRPVYGDVKQVNTTATISVIAALSDARARLRAVSVNREPITLDHGALLAEADQPPVADEDEDESDD